MEGDSGQSADIDGPDSTGSSTGTPETTASLTTSCEVVETSPLSKSRYGRTRKPKISEDFYNIDVIFDSAREPRKSPRATPQFKSPVQKSAKAQNSVSLNKSKSNLKPTLKSPKSSSKPKSFSHVTGDANTENQTSPKTVNKFFKREAVASSTPKSEQSIENLTEFNQNANTEIDFGLNSDVPTLTDETVDVTKVLKIISAKPSEPLPSNDSKGGSKPVLKTYSNKRKSFQKHIVESFGLPDTPIFPLEDEKSSALNEPKRIKNLDVAAPSSDSDINIVDKKLLDTPWKIASINADSMDNETPCDDLQDDTKFLPNSKEIGLSTTKIDENMNDNNTTPLPKKKGRPPKQKALSIAPENSPLKQKERDKQIASKNITEELIHEVEIKIQRNASPKKQKKAIAVSNDFKTKGLRNRSPGKQLHRQIDIVAVSDAQKNRCSVSPKKGINHPQRKSLRFQVDALENTPVRKSEDTSPPHTLMKVKNVDNSIESVDMYEESGDAKLNSNVEGNELNEVDLKIKNELNAVENGDSMNKRTNSTKRRRGQKSKIDSDVKVDEITETDEQLRKINVVENLDESVSDDTDDMNLLERSRLLNESSLANSGSILELKKEMDAEGDAPIKIDDNNEGDLSNVIPEISSLQQKNTETRKSYDVKIKPDVTLGDLMWAKIGSHPYWPCVVSEDPILNQYKCIRKPHRNFITLYHVRFFGDKGRRSWVSSTSLIRFNDKNDLNILREQVKSKTSVVAALQPYIVKTNVLPKWKNAVLEAESLKSSTVEQRFDFFLHIFSAEGGKRRKSLKLTNTENMESVQEQSIFENEIKQELESSIDADITKSTGTPKLNDSKKQIENESPTTTNFKKIPKAIKFHRGHTKLRLNPLAIKHIRSKSLPNTELSDNKKENLEKIEISTDTNLKPIKKGTSKLSNKQNFEQNSRTSLLLQKDISKLKLKKESRENSIDEPPDTLLKNPWQAFDMAKRQLNTPNEGNSEYSLSDTDSHSKSSTNTPVPNLYKDQITRQRRNNLFRGIPKHRVCQVCKKSGEILKCKGPCSGLFHFECSDIPSCAIKEEVSAENNGASENTICKNEEVNNDVWNDMQKVESTLKTDKVNAIELYDASSTNGEESYQNGSLAVEVKEDKVSTTVKSVAGATNNKVEIIHVDCDDSDFEHSLTPKVRLTPNIDFSTLTLAEKIDLKMKEIMQKFEKSTRYADSTTDYTSSEESSSNLLPPEPKPKAVLKKKVLKIKHVTADSVSVADNSSSEDLIGEGSSIDGNQEINSSSYSHGVSSTGNSGNTVSTSHKKGRVKKSQEQTIQQLQDCEASNDLHSTKEFKCGYCVADRDPPCFVCGKEVSVTNISFRQKCSLHMCGKFYHPECLKMWPQTQWSLISTAKHKNSDKLLDTFVCPVHVCHTCASDNPRVAISRCTSDKVVKCLYCPATYHTTNYCVPAGTVILSSSQIICPRHLGQNVVKKGKVIKCSRTINTPWCFICSKGGDLICCETCPTSVHAECLEINLLDDGAFICEDCETGRFPLYDEIVWVKLGAYRWWPAVILFPNEVPINIKNIPHSKGEFVVKFFGTHDHYWVHRGRVFLFQEGDRGHCSPTKKRVDALFKKSIEEAAAAHQFRKVFKMNKEAEIRTGMKPPPYIRVKVNKPVGNVRLFDGNISNTTSCECDPNQATPCGPDSDCLNRLLLTECDPNICPAKERCFNQRFEKRQYPPLVPLKTPARGWGLKTLAPIRKGEFVIEYVGEIIDEQEYQRRIHKMHEQKDENYYFLTIDKDRIIDAGPKGNHARFMNHCCQPNCETQKWTVNGDTRVGLFAVVDIPADAELTFNYNLECIGKEKKICKCGAPNCSGFIGVKAKMDESQKKPKKNNIKKKKQPLAPPLSKNEGPCFICGQQGDVGACHNKICTKFYHLHCVNLEFWPEGKWVCPWHNCDICSKRTIRCCVRCIRSYCPVHSEGNVRYDRLLGFVCSEHDPTKASQEIPNENLTTAKSSQTSGISTTEETDVTSTTPDEIESSSVNQIISLIEDNDLLAESSELYLAESVTSTPIKNKETTSFKEIIEDFNTCLVTNTPEDPNTSIPEKLEEESPLPIIGKRKRGRPRKSVGNLPKKLKLTSIISNEAVISVKQNFTTSNVLDIPAQNEVKLSSTVPTRHLRTTRSGGTNTDVKRFLSLESDLEKDLPIRKRSRPRCEASL